MELNCIEWIYQMNGTMQTIYMYSILGVLCILLYKVNAECSTGCSSCSGSICTQCESTYYLSGENCHRCPDNCNSCEDFDHCTSCIPNKWNLNSRCIHTCHNNCVNQECQINNGNCHQCKTGLYGLLCQRDCSLCENELCDLRACTYGCKSGYYDFNDGSEIFCQSCRANCKTCTNSYICDVCNDGFYLYKYVANARVFVDCSQCLGSSESCLDYCAIQDCDKCQVIAGSIVCTECSEGFKWNNDICLRITSKCSSGCSTECDDNGICLGSCNIGWTGERCSETCASECLTCAKNNPNVCEQCKEDYYTTSCNIKCSEHCNEITSKQTCNIDDGYCLNDCDRAYWGPFCNESCQDGCADDGMSIICERRNGSCKLECKDGYTGPKCDTFVLTTPATKSEAHSGIHDVSTIQTLTSTHFRSEENKDKNNGFITGYVSGFGSAAMVAALIVAMFLIRRRYIAKKSKMLKDSSHTYYNEQIEPTADIGEHNGTHNYETLNETRQAEMTYSELQRRV